ncbi:MAG: flavin reductase [Phycisphaeraceae bacterium]|nr:flavin reductase [Phycisphaeraceae bacterium]
MERPPAAVLDPAVRKKVLRMIPYGVFVVTARHNGQVHAATIDWVTQASFNPPMVVVCLRGDSQICRMVRESGVLGLHMLGEGQKALAADFFKNISGDDTQINGHACELGETGVPLLLEAPAAVELRVVDVLAQSDHHVVLGEVAAVVLRREAGPLLLGDTGWHYGG